MSVTHLDTHTTITEFDELHDVIVRVYSTRGSVPVVVVDEGVVQSAEAIGQRVLELFDYYLKSPVYDAARVTA
jgi:hypothetical protein